MASHKDLNVWKVSMDLTIKVYQLVESFPREEMFGLTSQIKRSVVSIPSNIAEGAARQSKAEFKRFLRIALGSASELETQIEIAYRLGYIKTTYLACDQTIRQIKSMLSKLIKSLD